METFSQIHIADSLDDALAWCENVVISHVTCQSQSGEFEMPTDFKDQPRYLRQIYSIVPSDVSYENVDKLFTYFKKRSVPTGTVLWRLGDESHHAVVLASGRLVNSLEDEPCTMETIEVGHLVGEYGLLTGHRRYGTLTATEPSVVLELDIERYREMEKRDPLLALVLSKICMAYLHHRVMHVSNRIWECHCLPV
jgi:CRP-like cAMP-binding protein